MKKEFNNKTGWLSLPAKYKKPRGVTPRFFLSYKSTLNEVGICIKEMHQRLGLKYSKSSFC